MMAPDLFVKTLLISYLVSISSACSHQLIPMQIVYSSNDCAIAEATVKTIRSAEELKQFTQTLPRSFSNTPRISQHIDYLKQTLILYAPGQQNSAGYAIKLEKKVAKLKDQIIYLPVYMVKPEKNSFQAQVMTSPCQIYAIPNTDFKEILLTRD